MRQSQRPFGGDDPPESRRLTPSIGLAPDGDPEPAVPSDASNEDFLFHLYRGSELLQDNRVHEAKEELERALHLQPRDTKGQDLLGVVYFRLGLYPRAISLYERLRRTNPTDPALLLNLALCYLKTGQPILARRDLETLLAHNPSHNRAWGYLGLACERLGDYAQAQRAFEQGGHEQMARRMAVRRESMNAPLPAEPEPRREVREVVATAYQELDAGDLSFALAEPTSDTQSNDRAAESWRPVELGQHAGAARAAELPRPPSQKPDTKDGPPPREASIPQLAVPAPSGERRPTLIAPVGAPPAHGSTDFAAMGKIPSQRPPSYTLDAAGTPSLRLPVVAVPPGGKRRTTVELEAPRVVERPRTLPRPVEPEAVDRVERTESAGRPSTEQAAQLRAPMALPRDAVVAFPERGGVVLHDSGVALVRTLGESGFAVRLESIRAQSNGLGLVILDRQTKGKSTGESFGGVGSPVVRASGDGELVLAPRPGRTISSFLLEDETCFAREEVLLGFEGQLAFENGRLATGEGEFLAVVQLRGRGAVLLEAIGDILTLGVHSGRSMSVRRDVVLGWFGRLVPRALSPSEAPCGQRGLVSFAGEGRVLVASA